MARGQREGLFPRGLVFHGLYEFKIMFLDEFLKRMKEIIREMPVEEKFELISSKEKMTEWVELKLMKFYDDVLYFEEDCSYTLINLSESRHVNDWICLYDDDEFVYLCKEYGYFDELINELEKELKKEKDQP
jgi:hypothetical protein